MRRILALVLAAAAAAACDHGREEPPPPPPDAFPGPPEPSAHPDPATGPFAKVQYVTLAASEPARIYYTTDGSDPVPGAPSTRSGRNPVFWIRAGPGTTTLTWFAVDDAGNRGPTAVATYEVILP